MIPGPPALYQTILAHPDREKLDTSTLRLAVTGAAAIYLSQNPTASPAQNSAVMHPKIAHGTIVLTSSCIDLPPTRGLQSPSSRIKS